MIILLEQILLPDPPCSQARLVLHNNPVRRIWVCPEVSSQWWVLKDLKQAGIWALNPNHLSWLLWKQRFFSKFPLDVWARRLISTAELRCESRKLISDSSNFILLVNMHGSWPWALKGFGWRLITTGRSESYRESAEEVWGVQWAEVTWPHVSLLLFQQRNKGWEFFFSGVTFTCRLWSWRDRFCLWCTVSGWRTGNGCWSEPAASPSRTRTPTRSSTSSAPTPTSSRFPHRVKSSSLIFLTSEVKHMFKPPFFFIPLLNCFHGDLVLPWGVGGACVAN